MIRIVSYNILSDVLCTPKQFFKRAVEDLEAKLRMQKIKVLIEKEIANDSIVCLQEVSQNFKNELFPLFEKNGYTMVSRLYGYKKSGYMGVSLAFPKAKYAVEDFKEEIVSNLIEVPDKIQPSFITILTNPLYEIIRTPILLLERLGLKKKEFKKETDFQNAKRRRNAVISLRLSQKENPEKSFWVSTYHMPCAFYAPNIMTLHVNGVLTALKNLKDIFSAPLILAGDFNIKPDTPQYNFITTGEISEEYPIEDNWNFKDHISGLKLKSSYKEALGKEPEFTNYAETDRREDAEAFIDTLDYIFVSDEFKVKSVKSLPSKTDASVMKLGSMPNAVEPSDHFLIAADLEL